jgi:hypothetical protein
MTLAKPVTNATGLTILATGTVLDQDLIRRLERMNLAAVYVEGTADQRGGLSLAEQEHQLARRFRKVAEDPVQQMIREAVRHHLRATYAVLPQGQPQAPAGEGAVGGGA